jgi:hypothetical protein
MLGTDIVGDNGKAGADVDGAPSYLHPCPFPPTPAVVPVGARYTSVDSHLKLPTATSAYNSKKSYCSKVNLEQ